MASILIDWPFFIFIPPEVVKKLSKFKLALTKGWSMNAFIFFKLLQLKLLMQL